MFCLMSSMISSIDVGKVLVLFCDNSRSVYLSERTDNLVTSGDALDCCIKFLRRPISIVLSSMLLLKIGVMIIP